MDAINQTRLRVWAQQPAAFFDRSDPRRRRHPRRHRRRVQAGHRHRLQRHLGLPSPAGLAGQHRRAALPGQSQRQPSLARAGRRLPRQGDRPLPPGRFSADPLRGDTDFTQTEHLDRWDDAGDIRFLFGIDAHATLKALADGLPAEAYSFLERPPRYTIKTAPRQQARAGQAADRPAARVRDDPPARGDDRRVRLSPDGLQEELSRGRPPQAAGDRPGADAAVRGVSLLLLHHQRSHRRRPTEIVFSANDRCDQENLIAQLKSGVHALTTPVDDLVSNWAYMVMASAGVEPEGLERAAGAGIAAARGQARGREAERGCGWSSRRSARR